MLKNETEWWLNFTEDEEVAAPVISFPTQEISHNKRVYPTLKIFRNTKSKVAIKVPTTKQCLDMLHDQNFDYEQYFREILL